MKENELNGYEMSRQLFEWSYENPNIISPNHIAIYSFCIDHWNRLGNKDKFGLPTGMTMEAIGIKNYKTFAKSFADLVNWGFIKLVQKSKNQYSSNIIALVKNTKAHTKALTKASTKAVSKHLPKQVQSIVDVIEPIKPIEPIKKKFDFKKSLLEIGVSEKIASDWIQVRKDKKASNTETAFNRIKYEIEKSGITADDCIRIAVEKNWRGFECEWIKNLNNGNSEIRKSDSSFRKNTSGNNAEDKKRSVDRLADMAEAILQNT